jgi:hypothetical protein
LKKQNNEKKDKIKSRNEEIINIKSTVDKINAPKKASNIS